MGRNDVPELRGQSNAGHDFGGSLSEAERRQLIEFLKLL